MRRKDRTAEFLLTHPVSRFRIVFEKMLCIFWQILILNTASILTSAITIYAIGETLKAKEFLLLHAACFLLRQKSRPYVLHFLPFCGEAV